MTVKRNPNKTEYERQVRSAIFESGITLRKIAAECGVKSDGTPCAISFLHEVITTPEDKLVEHKKRVAKYLGFSWRPNGGIR